MTEPVFDEALTSAILRLWTLAPGHVRRRIADRLAAGLAGTTVHPSGGGIADVRIAGVLVGRLGFTADGTLSGEAIAVWN